MTFHSKKGILEKPLWFLIDLILAVIIFYYSATYVDQITSTTSFEKSFLSRDLALVIDSLYAAPAEVMLQYPQKTLWFSYKFDHNKVSVFERKLLSLSKTAYFIEDKDLEFQPTVLNPKKEVEDSFVKRYISQVNIFSTKTPDLEPDTTVSIFLDKGTRELKISNEKVYRQIKLECPEVSTKDNPTQKTLLIDQTHINNVEIDALTTSTGYAIYNQLRTNFKDITHTRVGEIWDLQRNTEKINELTKQRRIEQADVILSIKIGTNPNMKNILKIQYSQESEENIQRKSEKLACFIANELGSEREIRIESASIIPTTRPIKDKISVLIELGNVHDPNNMIKQPEKVTKIGELIKKAVLDYYEN